jgi:lysophospholipase L1-like esterase
VTVTTSLDNIREARPFPRVKTIVLFGDSMLGRFTKARIDRLQRLCHGYTVLNCAAGGFTSNDGVVRAAIVAKMQPDVVVLSFGANDSAPDRLVELAVFASNIGSIVAAFSGAAIFGFLPPSVVEIDGIGPRGRTNRVLAEYRGVLRTAVPPSHAVDIDATLAPLIVAGTAVHEDGLHLNDAAYALAIAALAERITTV